MRTTSTSIPAASPSEGPAAAAQLASLAALAGPEHGFDRGEYAAQSSDVQGVVDMFGGSDITDVSDSEAFVRFLAWAEFGGSAAERRSASPAHYVRPGAPPFLILHGVDDPSMPLRHSVQLSGLLRKQAPRSRWSRSATPVTPWPQRRSDPHPAR